eukprot:TRINITY_DN10827_c0_g1_i1.p1 TRINITY_DN10827_c0_g1~~TRINITY_DN10827_c0_g1_i1.p1  ORF type:complete len:368 (-),score=47.24 TRINITY_DN10827_c0_g1_i1:71-1174(-)
MQTTAYYNNQPFNNNYANFHQHYQQPINNNNNFLQYQVRNLCETAKLFNSVQQIANVLNSLPKQFPKNLNPPLPHISVKKERPHNANYRNRNKKRKRTDAVSMPFKKKKIDEPQYKTEISLESIRIIVVDTNCFLRNFTKLCLLQHYKGLKLVVPYVVIQELDGLKKSNDSKIAYAARTSLKMLNQNTNEEWLSFQTVYQKQSHYYSTGADDHILDCAIYYQRNISQTGVVLATNDQGLQLKAKINKVMTLDIPQIIDVLPVFKGEKIDLLALGKAQYGGKGSVRCHNNAWDIIGASLGIKELLKLQCVNKNLHHHYSGDSQESNNALVQCLRNMFNDKKGSLITNNTNAIDWYKKWKSHVLPAHQS